jgi:superfamily II DNA or RNA helicase
MTVLQERVYQDELIEQTIELVSSKRKVLVQSSTGSGKTVIFAKIARRYFRSQSKSVLILVHREELLHQAQRAIKHICGIDATLITAGFKGTRANRVYIGMVESTVTRLNAFIGVGLVIIDECHVANFNKVHQFFLEELIIGFTATPIAASKKEPLNKYYHGIVAGPQIHKLIKDGYLAQNITRCPKDIVDSTQFEIDVMKGDFKERAMSTEFSKPRYLFETVKAYMRIAIGSKAIVFNVTKEHSKQQTQVFKDFGFKCKHLDSDNTTEERAAILKWFKETPDAILCNVMIATVGFDEPTIETVILNYSTLSLAKFIQCCGRGSRPIADTKTHFNIIDMGGNCIRFGDWNDDRDWIDLFENPSKPAGGLAPIKTCPECEALVYASARICQYCQYEFPQKERAKEQHIEEIVLVTKNIDMDRLIAKNAFKYEYYTFDEMAHKVVEQLLTEHPNPNEKQKLKFFDIYYGLCVDWYSKVMANKNGNISTIENSNWHKTKARYNFDKLLKQQKCQE